MNKRKKLIIVGGVQAKTVLTPDGLSLYQYITTTDTHTHTHTKHKLHLIIILCYTSHILLHYYQSEMMVCTD